MTVVHTQDKDWTIIGKDWEDFPSKDLTYFENNSANRDIFLKMGYKEEDLDKYESLFFMLTQKHEAKVVEYNSMGKPTNVRTETRLIFSIGYDKTCPSGLAGDNLRDNFTASPTILTSNPWKISVNKKTCYGRQTTQSSGCSCECANCFCRDKCHCNCFANNYCIVCYGDFQTDFCYLKQFLGSWNQSIQRREIRLENLNPRHDKPICYL